VAWESSQPHVEARGSSQPHVECSGYCQLSISGNATVRATPTNAILSDGVAAIEGGIVIVRPQTTTAELWCTEYGVGVEDGVAIVYKGVNDDFRSPHGGIYTPGSIPVADDWDGGNDECGGGLHFSPTPLATKNFYDSATRFVACPVALSAMRPPKATDEYPSKIKASGCCAPVYEVDRYGRRVAHPVTVEAGA